jgi:hypothetical protein
MATGKRQIQAICSRRPRPASLGAGFRVEDGLVQD